MNNKNFFYNWLCEKFSSLNDNDAEVLFKQFEKYHAWLVDENEKINLFSRKMEADEIWTKHFLDALLPIAHVEFGGKKILDFGTGGGIPGIPIAIVYNDCEMTLLDSTKKKIAAIKRGVDFVGLKNCNFIDTRIEEAVKIHENILDMIVSRGVAIEPRFKKAIFKMLKPQGKIVLYKSKISDDVKLFDNVKIFDVSIDVLGERKIVVAQK